MKRISFIIAATLLVTATSCNKEVNPMADNDLPVSTVKAMTFTAVADNSEATRTILDDHDIKWSVGEGIYVFDGVAPRAFASTNTEEAGVVTFEGSAAEAQTYYAIYPSGTMSGSTLTATIPVFQTATAGTFAPKANVAVAVSNTNSNDPTELQFKNVGAVVKFAISDADVVKVRLDAINGEALTGKVNITVGTDGTPTVEGVTDATESCAILDGGSTALTAGSAYYFCILPGQYSGGFKVTLFKADGKFKSFSNKNAQTLSRSGLMDFGTLPAVTNWKTPKIDVLTRESTGVTSQTYTEWSNVTCPSDAVYAGCSAGSNDAIQLRTKESNSGIVTTKSAGSVAKVSVDWETHTSAGRSIDIYGKATAYRAATELYDEETQGTLIGSINYGSSSSLTVSGDYAYIGIRSHDGALYLSSVTIEWAGSGVAPVDPVVAAPTFAIEGPDSNIIPSAGGSASFVVKSNIPWTIALDDEEAAEYTLSTTGENTTVTVSMGILSEGSRTATFTITPSDGDPITVAFKQTVASAIVLTFPDDNSENNKKSSYSNSWTAITGDYSFTIGNFNNNNWNSWTYIKCGSNSGASTGTITTQKIDFAVSSIVVTVDDYKNADKVQATTKLEVAADANFSSIIATVNNVTVAKGDLTYTVPSSSQDKNLFYRVSYVCKKATNGAIQISKVVVNPKLLLD